MLQSTDNNTGGSQLNQNKLDNITPLSDAINALGIKLDGISKTIVETFDKFEEISITFNKELGGGAANADRVRENILGAADAAQKLGFTLVDLQKLRGNITGIEKTNFLLQQQQYSQLLALGDITKGIGEDATAQASKAYDTFTKLGYSANGVVTQGEKIVQNALSIGVSAGAVYDELEKNVKTLNLYNFDNGVQGMAKMAAEAVMLKYNMSNTLQLAEKLFDPQQAVDLAAGLQRMGVQISGLLDPISLMNMAENDPEELQKNLIELSQRYVEFNKEQGRFQMMPGAGREVREIAKLVNMTTDEFLNLGIESSELSKKMSQIKFPTADEFASDDTRKLIANMAQLNEQTGKFEVEIYDEKLGQNVKKAVDSLTVDKSRGIDDMAGLKKAQENASKTIEQLQIDANGLLKEVANNTALLTDKPIRAAATSNVLTGIKEMIGGAFTPVLDTINQQISTQGLREGINSVTSSLSDVSTSLKNGDLSLSDALGKVANNMVDGSKEIVKKISQINISEEYEKARQKYEQTHTGQKAIEVPSVVQDMINKVSPTSNEVQTITPPVTQVQDALINKDGIMVSDIKGKFATMIDPEDKILASPNIAVNTNPQTTSKTEEVKHTHEMNIKLDATQFNTALSNIVYSNEFKNQFIKQMDYYKRESFG
jgi:hypothetical protein